MSSQESLSKMQKNTVVSGIVAISLASWYFLFIMNSNMAHMNIGTSSSEMKMDMKPKSEMKMDMKPKSEMKMDMKPKSETWLPDTYWMPPMDNNWGTNDFYQLIVMWIIMMIAMMSPSIIPAVLMFATVNKAKQKNNLQYTPTYILFRLLNRMGVIFNCYIYYSVSFAPSKLNQSNDVIHK
jgi:predicted metal-binding membrane protein